MIRHAACQCGALTLRCEGEPAMVAVCHCLDCQRRTGSLFGANAFFTRTAVAVTAGRARTFRRRGTSGGSIAMHFCPDCGSTLWWEPERMPGVAGVAVGAFAEPGFPPPRLAVWDERRHAWLELPPGIPSHPRSPG